MNNTRLRKLGKNDRISRLPDSILLRILSYLSTERAVQTSILSSRWKLVWTSLSNLEFNDRLCYNREGGNSTNDALTKFENFVDRMLLSSSISINKFSLHCWNLRYLSHLKFWISVAIMRNVHEIEVNLDHPEEGVELPECIYNSETLEFLKLQSDFVFKNPSSGMCFPRVKKFHVEIYEQNLPDFSVCPVLEDLQIVVHSPYDSSANVNIFSQTLKRLSFYAMKDLFYISNVHQDLFYNSNVHQVMIRAPNLEYLYIRDEEMVTYVVHDELHFLSDADLRICYRRGYPDYVTVDRALQLIKNLTKLKSLFLSDTTIHVLGDAYQNIFPTFPNLSHLKLEIGECGWRMLPIILNSSPNLESLNMDTNPLHLYDDLEVEEWIEPQFVPHCLRFNVKKIEFFNLEEMEPVKYLLKNCDVLNLMIIRYEREPLSFKELCRKLLMFPRGSKTCQVEFQGF